MGKTSFNKIFLIGFNKTATTSLDGFFNGNGLRSIHWDDGKLAVQMVQNAIAGRKILHGYDHKYVVYSDAMYLNDRICIEANFFYPTLDRDYPGSAFIYNTRSEEDWIESRLTHGAGFFLEKFKKIRNTDSVDQIVEHW